MNRQLPATSTPQMLVLNSSGSKWKKKAQTRSSFLSISLLTLTCCFIFFLMSYICISKPLLSTSSKTLQLPRCSTMKTLGHRFLWFSPHSGFSNQLSEFKNAILMAAILNRTLIVPPILDHHAVVLGSCPKFRVSSPSKLREAVWNHVVELIKSHRYVSMADIIDISSLVSSAALQTIDFRLFASLWCGMNLDFACFNGSNIQFSLFDSLRKCGSFLSNPDSSNCVYASNEDCRTTVWTYQRNEEDVLDSFQLDKQLQKKKNIFYIRKRRDVYKTLGPGSEADRAIILAFGSLFTAQYKGSQLYIDIAEAPKDQRIQSLIKRIEFLPFVPQIVNAGKKFASETIKAPFFCAQLRLLDGQFKNHWRNTFVGFKEKVESLRSKGPLPIHIFVMTDLSNSNWSGTYLGDLERDLNSFKLYVLRAEDELVKETAEKLVGQMKKGCNNQGSLDILLYIEESVCSCASLGFFGTAGSTIAESIEQMRKSGICLRQG